MRAFLFLITLFFAQNAIAQDKAVVCNLLKQQQSVKSAAYEPGVDAYGNAVVPADVNATTSIPDVVEIPLEIDLAERLNGVNQDGLRLYTSFGTIKIRTDGQVMHGGQDVTGKVHDWCGTPVPEILDEVQEDITEPVLEEKPVEEADVILKDQMNKEMEVIEIEAKTPILPQEVSEADEPPLPKEDILTGSDYRDYNE